MADPKKLKREDPVRLRQCLNALAESAGRDIWRLEMRADANGGITLFFTSSRDTTEEKVAAILWIQLQALLAGGESK